MLTKRLDEIAARKAELRSEVDVASEERLAEIEAEAEALNNEEAEIRRKLLVSEKLNFAALQGNTSNEKREFFEILRRGVTTTQTAYDAVPTVVADEIVESLQQESNLLSNVSVYQVPGRFSVPVITAGKGSTKKEGEAGNVRTLSTTGVPLGGYELVYLIQTSAAVEAMSTDAFSKYIIDSTSRALATGLEELIVTGRGAQENTLTGLLKPFADGTAKHVVAYSSMNYDTITQALGELPSFYHTAASFVMSRKTYFSRVAAIKDDSKRPIVFNDIQSSPTWSVLGYPVIFSDFVPDGTIILGDMTRYAVNFSAPMRIDVSEHFGFDAGLRTYRALAVVDGAPVDMEAFVFVTQQPA